MVLASLQTALGLLRSPPFWLPGLAAGAFAGSSFILQAVAGTFLAERLLVLEMVTLPFFLAGLLFMVKTSQETFSSFATGGILGYFRVLLPSIVLIFFILVTILLLLIPLMIIGIAGTVFPFMAISVSITILIFASFYDTAAIIEDRKVFDSIRRSVEFVLQHARDCGIFYLVVILTSFLIALAGMILWTAVLYDRIAPLASFTTTEIQSFTLEQFNALLGMDGVFITALFLFAGLTVLVAIITCFKACFFADRSPGRTDEPAQQGEVDSKGRWYKY
jgi:hypothetical protein